jgi:hypothetical protein
MDKKTGLLIGAALVTISSSLFAADTACSAASSATSGSVNSGSFIVNAFSMKCSKNVHLGHIESTTAVGVCAGSSKGNKMYGGSSEGGAIAESTSAYTGQAMGTINTTTGC